MSRRVIRHVAVRDAVSVATAILLIAGQCRAEDTVQIRLHSEDAMVDVEGTATLHDYDLTGHLIGDDVEATVTGVVKSGSVTANLVGKFVPNCGMPRQFMSGSAANDGASTSISMTFHCAGKGGQTVGGEEYQFHLDVTLPAHGLHPPISPDGEAASLE
jgi:hypothetical protein